MTNQIITEEKPSPEPKPWAKIGIFFSTLALLIFICVFGYGYFALSKVNRALARSVSDLQNKTALSQKEMAALQGSLQNLQQAEQKSQVLSLEQEKLLSEWQSAQKGNLEKWRVAEAQYLVRLANDHLQFTYHFPIALGLLQRADQVLQNLQDDKLLGIRKSLNSAIAGLQAAPETDITALYTRLNNLNQALDRLSLPSTPLQAQKEEPVPPNLPWWQTGMAYSWQALKKIVIVRNTENNMLPLVLPEEKIFLYQNLHAQMENAMWGVLHRNAEVYSASLVRLKGWILTYFDQDQEAIKTLQTVNELQKMNIQPPAANLSLTLQLFDDYFSKINAAS